MISYPRITSCRFRPEYHNPSILTARFLSEYGIVPEHWIFADASSGWQFSQVRYQNNFTVSLGPSTLDVEDRRRAVPDGETTAVEVVSRYLEAVQLVNYRSLAAHLVWESPRQDPGQFLTNRFLHPTFRNGDLSYLLMDPRFRFAVGNWNINAWLYAAWLTQPEDDTAQSLSVNVQATSGAVENVNAARETVAGWPAIQEVIELVVHDLVWRDDHGSA